MISSFPTFALVKIAIVAPRFPYPIEKGDKLRLYHQIKGLAQNHQIFLFCVSDVPISKPDKRHLLQYCQKIYLFNLSKLQIIGNLLRGFYTSLPFQVAYFYSRKVKSEIQEKILKHNPDVVFTQLIRSAPYTRALPYYKVIDYMDCFSLNTIRRTESSPWYQQWFWKWEVSKVKKFEKSILFDYDQQCIISGYDRSQLPLLSKDRVRVIPNGIDLQYFNSTSVPETLDDKFDLLFAGNLGYYPNVKAAQFLLKHILTSLPKHIKLCLAGARPHKSLRVHSDRVLVTGWVEDIRGYYRNAKLFVAPIFEGAGLQNKILEAMALGIPCITTSIVNNSIKAKAGAHLLIADTADEFIMQINYLLENPDKRQRIADEAIKFVVNHYNWNLFNARLEKLLTHDGVNN